MVQFSYLWANLRRARTYLQFRNGFLCCTCAPNPTSLKTCLIMMSNNNLHVLNQSCLVVADVVPSRPLVTKVIQRLFSRPTRHFGCAPLWLSISPPTSFLICATKDWLMPTKLAILRVETLFLSCTKAWCFCSWDNAGIWLQNDSTNYTSRTMEPRLHNAQEISRRSQLHNAHRDVDVRRVMANKNEYCNHNHFDIFYFRKPKPFSIFGFTIM